MLRVKPIPALVLALALIVYVLLVLTTQARLPDRVATHFNLKGQADGWMPRQKLVTIALCYGPGMACFLSLAFYLIGFLPPSMFNLPHKDYWTSPAVFPHTRNWLFQHSLWMSTALLVFLGGLHALTVVANSQSPPRLSAVGTWVLTAGILCFTVTWTLSLVFHFNRKP
jgi:hypothetical protein